MLFNEQVAIFNRDSPKKVRVSSRLKYTTGTILMQAKRGTMLIDSEEAGRRLKLSKRRVNHLLREGRISGATKIGGQRGLWVIEVVSGETPVVLPPARFSNKQGTA